MKRTLNRTELLIGGMRGSRCREWIISILGGVAGVKEVDVNLYRARAVVLHDATCAAAQLVEAVELGGYSAAVAGRADRRPQSA